ncbi:MAG: ATP-dependent DNA ligase [Minisyncoccia bacterium]
MPETTFRRLAEVFSLLEKTSSSLAMIDILSEFFKKISPKEAKISAYLISGEISPSYANLELGLAKKLVAKAIGKATNKTQTEVEKLLHKKGDLGIVVEDLLETQKGRKYSIEEVFEELKKIAKLSGEGSQEEKINLLANLIKNVSPLEAKYIVRLVLGILRLGVGEMTFLYSISKALTGTKEKKKILEYAFNVLSDLGEVTFQALEKGIENLKNAKPVAGIPIRMMLAQRIKDLKEIKEHINGKISVEYKYDGERIQAHVKKDKEIILFSRNHENITSQFPDVIGGIKGTFKGKETIIEGEVVALDLKTEKLLDFQTLMTRRRKYNVKEYIKKVPIRYFLFDILYLDGKPLLQENLLKRKKFLEEAFVENELVKFAKYIISESEEETEEFFLEAIKNGAEGIMIKDANSIYQAGIRGWNWIKYKKDYHQEITDTFDLVVIGANYGSGKRAGTFGSLLVAAFDQNKNKFYSFTKVGAGFTDDDLKNLPKILNPFKIPQKYKMVETGMEADVWFEPKIVMEVAGADITISPVHTVAKDKIKKGGLALRFPRFIRWREDKKSEDATTVEEIYQMYKK